MIQPQKEGRMGRFRGGRVFKPIPNVMSMGIALRHSSSSFALAALVGPAAATHVRHGFRASMCLAPKLGSESRGINLVHCKALCTSCKHVSVKFPRRYIRPSRQQLTMQSLFKPSSCNVVNLDLLSPLIRCLIACEIIESHQVHCYQA